MLWHMLQTQSRPAPVWLPLVCCCVWLYSNEIESPSSRSMYLPSASMTACAASVFSNSYNWHSPVRKLRPWCAWLIWQGITARGKVVFRSDNVRVLAVCHQSGRFSKQCVQGSDE